MYLVDYVALWLLSNGPDSNCVVFQIIPVVLISIRLELQYALNGVVVHRGLVRNGLDVKYVLVNRNNANILIVVIVRLPERS